MNTINPPVSPEERTEARKRLIRAAAACGCLVSEDLSRVERGAFLRLSKALGVSRALVSAWWTGRRRIGPGYQLPGEAAEAASQPEAAERPLADS